MPPQVLMKVDGSLGGGGALIHMLMPFMCLVVDRKQGVCKELKHLTTHSSVL